MAVPAPEQAVWLRLKSSTGVGDLAGDRVYPLRAPSSAIGSDYVVYRRVSGVYTVSHSAGGPQYQQARIQVDSYSATYDGAVSLGVEVRRRLAGYTGSTGGIRVWNISLANDRDLDEGEPGEDRLYRRFQDYMVEARVTT